MVLNKNVADREYKKFAFLNNKTTVNTNSNNDFFFDIALGKVEGIKYFSSRGRNPNIDSGQSVDVWSLADIIPRVNYPSADVTMYMSSTNVGDVGNLIIMEGLDVDYNEQTGVATLNGQNQVEIKDLLGNPITFLRFFRAQNLSSSELLGDVYIAESDTLTGGIPDTNSKKYSKLLIGDERTFDAIYTIPAGKVGNAALINFSVNRGKDALLKTRTRSEGGVFVTGNNFDVYQSFLSPTLLRIPGFVGEKTDIVFSTTVNNEDTTVTAKLDLIVVDEEVLA